MKKNYFKKIFLLKLCCFNSLLFGDFVGGIQFLINPKLDYNRDLAYAGGKFVVAPVVKNK